jgi:hypothetical protein
MAKLVFSLASSVRVACVVALAVLVALLHRDWPYGVGDYAPSLQVWLDARAADVSPTLTTAATRFRSSCSLPRALAELDAAHAATRARSRIPAQCHAAVRYQLNTWSRPVPRFYHVPVYDMCDAVKTAVHQARADGDCRRRYRRRRRRGDAGSNDDGGVIDDDDVDNAAGEDDDDNFHDEDVDENDEEDDDAQWTATRMLPYSAYMHACACQCRRGDVAFRLQRMLRAAALLTPPSSSSSSSSVATLLAPFSALWSWSLTYDEPPAASSLEAPATLACMHTALRIVVDRWSVASEESGNGKDDANGDHDNDADAVAANGLRTTACVELRDALLRVAATRACVDAPLLQWHERVCAACRRRQIAIDVERAAAAATEVAAMALSPAVSKTTPKRASVVREGALLAYVLRNDDGDSRDGSDDSGNGDDITLVAQCTVDRLAAFASLSLAHWTGPALLVVFVKRSDDNDDAVVASVAAAVSASPLAARARTTVAVYRPPPPPSSSPSASSASLPTEPPLPFFFPKNEVRNVAVSLLPPSTLYLLVDADFMPSRGAHKQLRAAVAAVAVAARRRRENEDGLDASTVGVDDVIVVPAFEYGRVRLGAYDTSVWTPQWPERAAAIAVATAAAAAAAEDAVTTDVDDDDTTTMDNFDTHALLPLSTSVPSFLPTTRRSLLHCVAAGVARAYHSTAYEHAHAATDNQRWLQPRNDDDDGDSGAGGGSGSSDDGRDVVDVDDTPLTYRVRRAHAAYEPYVVLRSGGGDDGDGNGDGDADVLYDERFAGRGWNRVSLIYALRRRRRVRLHVARRAFVLHLPHAAPRDTAATALAAAHNDELWRLFRSETEAAAAVSRRERTRQQKR